MSIQSLPSKSVILAFVAGCLLIPTGSSLIFAEVPVLSALKWLLKSATMGKKPIFSAWAAFYWNCCCQPKTLEQFGWKPSSTKLPRRIPCPFSINSGLPVLKYKRSCGRNPWRARRSRRILTCSSWRLGSCKWTHPNGFQRQRFNDTLRPPPRLEIGVVVARVWKREKNSKGNKSKVKVRRRRLYRSSLQHWIKLPWALTVTTTPP